MRYLPDTQVLLWFLAEPYKLSAEATARLSNATPAPLYSAVSIWEIAIKQSLGRSDFTVRAEHVRFHLLLAGWQELAFMGTHAVTIATLPPIHRDPFDRALLAQAIIEDMTLLTSDGKLASYPGPVLRM